MLSAGQIYAADSAHQGIERV